MTPESERELLAHLEEIRMCCRVFVILAMTASFFWIVSVPALDNATHWALIGSPGCRQPDPPDNGNCQPADPATGRARMDQPPNT